MILRNKHFYLCLVHKNITFSIEHCITYVPNKRELQKLRQHFTSSDSQLPDKVSHFPCWEKEKRITPQHSVSNNLVYHSDRFLYIEIHLRILYGTNFVSKPLIEQIIKDTTFITDAQNIFTVKVALFFRFDPSKPDFQKSRSL